jgi:hypothetical protein
MNENTSAPAAIKNIIIAAGKFLSINKVIIAAPRKMAPNIIVTKRCIDSSDLINE